MTEAAASYQQQPVSFGKHPPKPSLTLRVGISGHRPKDTIFPLASEARVRRQLREVFDAIDRALEELNRENADFYAQHEEKRTISPKVRLISGLAEGADQMAVEARPVGWDIDAIFPFPEDEYLKDFEKSARNGADVTAAFEALRDEAGTIVQLPLDPLMPRHEPSDDKEKEKYWLIRSQAYARLGRFLLGQIDVLFAVWNGQREEGPGGTAEVVRGALDAGIPVVWISTLDDVPPRMVLDVTDDARPVAPDADALQGPLKSALTTIISVPTAAPEPAAGHGEKNPSPRERLGDFFNETSPKPTWWVAYERFRCKIEGKPRPWRIKPTSPHAAAARLEHFINGTPAETGGLRVRVRRILSQRFGWADSLAIERSNWYRSAYITCFLLATVLVAIALLGVFVHDFYHDDAAMLRIKAVLGFAELLLIVYIVAVVLKGRRSRWQGRWVEYRALAEMLRSATFLAYLGEHGYVHRRHELEPASSTWFLWYLRATVREVGLPSAPLTASYQNQLLLAVEEHVIDGQLSYNRKTAETLAAMHRKLHKIGDRCFLLTGVIIGVFLLAYIVYLMAGICAGIPFQSLIGWDHHTIDLSTKGLCGDFRFYERLGYALFWTKSPVTFAAAFLPALGAAVFGIRETGDFEGFSKRAARTAEKLQQIKNEMAKAKRRLTLESTRATLLAVAQVLSEDVGAWQSVYGRKQLNLPG